MAPACAYLTAMARAGSNDWIEYGERMNRVTAYAFDHLGDALDLNRLAAVASRLTTGAASITPPTERISDIYLPLR